MRIFNERLRAKLQAIHIWVFHGDDKDLTWYESNRRLLALSVWARTDIKDGAVKALADLAMWIHQNAFSG
ncbi:hypothetical protein DF022_21395 [Burkholderia cepacia]|nr:hypothetical protein WI47_14100 [Burkholderia cepacia]KVC16414.1 hypothetical protein WI70_02380 [Burkholderia cepacia]KVS72372.1 hypothetical protein WK40_02875 [Burkholderia cepacia]KWB31555.1 hypothetical protein WL34_28055 [Burkholderia cepacia]RQT81852.1 hypothetical protein DF023_21595 [Burkholderia cepacia]